MNTKDRGMISVGLGYLLLGSLYGSGLPPLATRAQAQATATTAEPSAVPPATLTPSPAGDSATADATAAFDRGDFAGAASAYEGLVHHGVVNGHLYYNLGVVYYRLGRVGDAMAAFLAARRYLPRDPDVAANLRFLVSGIHDQLDAEMPRELPGRLLGCLDSLTAKELAWITAWLCGACGSLTTLAWLVPRLSRWRARLTVSLALPILAAICLGLQAANAETWGAVCTKVAQVYSGPGPKNPVVFELQEGAPVRTGGRIAGGYLQVELSDGKRGWIPDTDVKVF